jgi:hypothetical protein
MGANAVTTVPVYVSGEVLTAADLNITNSGIPVFADSTARDAAFGGAGEKTLAEGQFAYLEDTNATQYYDSSGWITVNLLAAINSAEVLTSQTTTSTSYTDLATVGPAVTVTTGTSAIVLITTQASPSVQGPNACMSCAVSGATTIAASDSFRAVGGDPYETSVASTNKYTTLTAGSNTFTAKYRATTSTARFQNRTLTIWAL